MQSRLSAALGILRYVLIGGIVVLAVLIGLYLLNNNRVPDTELERAMFAAEEAVRANPENPAARVKLAAVYLESGAIESAREQANYAVRLAPDDPSTYYILGLVQSAAGETDDAIETLNRAATTEGQLAGFYQDAWASLSMVYEDAGQDDKALEAMNKALNFGPENAELLLLRGGMYERNEQWADALYDYVQAIQFVPQLDEAREGIDSIVAAHPEVVDEVKERFGVNADGSFVDTSTAQ